MFGNGINEQVAVIVSIGLGAVILLTAIILLTRRFRSKKKGMPASAGTAHPESALEDIVQAQGMARIRELEDQLKQKTLEVEQLKARCDQFAKKLTEAQSLPQGKVVHASPSAMPDETKRILVVDDNEKVRNLAVEILRKLDYRTETAESGAAALHKIEDSAPRYYDLVLMDAIMPEIDGYETASKIRALPRRDVKALPILVMAANTFDREHRLAQQARIDGIISKPIKEQELSRAVQRHLPFDAENFNYII